MTLPTALAAPVELGMMFCEAPRPALQDPEVVVDHLGQGGQTVGSTGGVGYDLHVLVVGLLVDAHHKHGGISGGGRDDDLLRPALVVGPGLLEGGEHPGALHHVHGPHAAPGDGGGVTLGEDGDGATINHQLAIGGGDLALVLTMSRVILEHIDHVVQVNEGIVDGDNIGPLLKSGPEDQATDAAKSVDSDGSHVYTSLSCRSESSNIS